MYQREGYRSPIVMSGASCGGPFVLVDEPAQAVLPDDFAGHRGTLPARERRPQPKGAVRPGRVVVPDVLPQDRPKVALAQGEAPVEAVLPYGAKPTARR